MIDMKKRSLLSTTAFDNSTGWKLDDDGKIEMREGNPIFLNAGGQEMTVAQDTISKLNNEAKTHREAKETALDSLKRFDGLDAEAARKALEIVSKLDAKTLVDAGKMDELKAQLSTQYQTTLGQKDDEYKKLRVEFDAERINSVFSVSQFIRDNIAVPVEMFQDTFGKNFKVEDGKIVAHDRSGNRLMSKTRVGEEANPDEALEYLVEAYPQKNSILKASVGSGSGSDGAGGNRTRGTTVVKRSEFDNMPHSQKSEVTKKIKSGEMKLTD